MDAAGECSGMKAAVQDDCRRDDHARRRQEVDRPAVLCPPVSPHRLRARRACQSSSAIFQSLQRTHRRKERDNGDGGDSERVVIQLVDAVERSEGRRLLRSHTERHDAPCAVRLDGAARDPRWEKQIVSLSCDQREIGRKGSPEERESPDLPTGE